MKAYIFHSALNRRISFLLLVAMLISFLPIQAIAYDAEPPTYTTPASIAISPLSIVQSGTWQELRAEVIAAGTVPTTIEITNNIYLPAGTTYDAITIAAGQNITLMSVPGETYTIQRIGGTARHFVVNGTLTLENIALSGNYPILPGNHGGIEVRAGGSLYMEEGSVIGNNRRVTNDSASAVYVTGVGSTFTMNGGEISHNNALSVTATNSTGAAPVFVISGAVFTMNDGVIRYNTGRFGGGVRIGRTAAIGGDNRMYLHGGEIYNNTAFFGGGVNLEFGTFTMTDGIIRDNIATGFQNNTTLALTDGRGGGGVFIQNSGIFNMQGGIISGNHSYTHGGGVMSGTPAANQFNMTGGTISDNTAYYTGPLATATNTGGGVRMTNGVFTMTSGMLEDGTITSGTITGNIAGNDGGGIWIGTGTAIANARLNLNVGAGAITDNTSLFGNGGGIFTVANNGYPPSLLATHYPNILATAPFIITFSGNVAGGGKFEPPANADARPFGFLLNNYDINYIGLNRIALITFILNGGNVAGDTDSIGFTIPQFDTIDASDIPDPEKLLYEFIGWIRVGDSTYTILSEVDIKAEPIETSTAFIAQWEPLDPIIITYLSGTDGTFSGGKTNASETLIATGGYPTQVPTPIANYGFRFIGWSSDDGLSLLSTAELMALFIDTNTTFTAHWEICPYANGDNGYNGYNGDNGYNGYNGENGYNGYNGNNGENGNNGGNHSNNHNDSHDYIPGHQRPPSPPPAQPELPSRQAYLIGTDLGYIRPNANITRAEVATIFFRLIDDSVRASNWSQTNPYSDVVLENWFNNAISTTTRMGIFKGRPDGTFAPNQAITRAELTAAAMRFMGTTEIQNTDEDLFTDISGHWANMYINAMAANNWVHGPNGQGGTFYPDRPITRAETAAIINRIFERLPEYPADLLSDMITWPDNANTGAWYYLYLQSASNSYTFEIKPNSIHERWIALIPVRDWAELERPNSVP